MAKRKHIIKPTNLFRIAHKIINLQPQCYIWNCNHFRCITEIFISITAVLPSYQLPCSCPVQICMQLFCCFLKCWQRTAVAEISLSIYVTGLFIRGCRSSPTVGLHWKISKGLLKSPTSKHYRFLPISQLNQILSAVLKQIPRLQYVDTFPNTAVYIGIQILFKYPNTDAGI